MHKKIVGVIGGRQCTDEVERLAHELGKKLAKVVKYLVCGGLSGVMVHVSKGFQEEGGTTIGIIPGYAKEDANAHIDIVVPTGLGLARNVLVVTTADVVIALPGESGTLSEIAYCLQFNKPVLSLGSWDIPGVVPVATADEAVAKTREIVNRA